MRKAFLFAAYDGCCAESDGFFGIWRPALLRTGAGADGDIEPVGWLSNIVPLAGVAAYATASALVDVPSGRLPGQFVVDNSGGDGSPPYLPSCVAFEPNPAVSPAAAPLIVLMTAAHHFNDRVDATLQVNSVLPPSAFTARNGLGAAMPLVVSGNGAGWIAFNFSIGALPQYVELPADASATAACATLRWNAV